jgi:hypothetical protein
LATIVYSRLFVASFLLFISCSCFSCTFVFLYIPGSFLNLNTIFCLVCTVIAFYTLLFRGFICRWFHLSMVSFVNGFICWWFHLSMDSFVNVFICQWFHSSKNESIDIWNHWQMNPSTSETIDKWNHRQMKQWTNETIDK